MWCGGGADGRDQARIRLGQAARDLFCVCSFSPWAAHVTSRSTQGSAWRSRAPPAKRRLVYASPLTATLRYPLVSSPLVRQWAAPHAEDRRVPRFGNPRPWEGACADRAHRDTVIACTLDTWRAEGGKRHGRGRAWLHMRCFCGARGRYRHAVREVAPPNRDVSQCCANRGSKENILHLRAAAPGSYTPSAGVARHDAPLLSKGELAAALRRGCGRGGGDVRGALSSQKAPGTASSSLGGAV